MLEVLKRIPHVAGTHFPHEVDDIPALRLSVVEPEVLDGIDLERRVGIAVPNGTVIPKLAPAHPRLCRLDALALEIGRNGDALGLGDVHA